VPILADTSVWIDHFRRSDERLGALLARRAVVLHPFVLGELALGSDIKFRKVVDDLKDLPRVTVPDHDELLEFILQSRLSGSGIGYVDAHLLASALLTPDTRLWTRDKKLRVVAERLQIAADEAG
jgi:predicted nucleic acid-binding protein